MMASKIVAVSVSRLARVEPIRLFQLLDDARSWPTWSVVGSVSFERPNDASAQVVGARRTFSTGILSLREEIIKREPDRRIDYAVLSGLPLDNYVGRIELQPVNNGTLLTWSATFHARRFGTRWFWKRAIRMILARMSLEAVRAAERLQSGRSTNPLKPPAD